MYAGPELLNDVPSCVAADGGSKIAESGRDGLRLIRNELRPIPTVSCVSNSCRGECPEQIRRIEYSLPGIVTVIKRRKQCSWHNQKAVLVEG